MEIMKYLLDSAYKCFLADFYVFGYHFNFLAIFLTVFIFSLLIAFVAKILN